MFSYIRHTAQEWWHKKVLALLGLLLVPGMALAQPSGQDSTVTVAAGKRYQRSALHRLLWGKHYRQVWAEPVQAPLFWLRDVSGGLSPIKEGGSFQTKNLRLVDPMGHEYVLRSIDKDPTGALPKLLQKTFVAKLMQDQTSVIHPYGAFIVPVLAQAAQVHHTNPRLVYVANDPALGKYRDEFAHLLALLEERPDGDWQGKESFGNPIEIVSSRSAFEKLMDGPRHRADAKRYLRSRLFDMWLSDWSRREDQWRWGVHKKDSLTVYSPIPRDRDHAFFRFNDGLFTKLVALFKPNYQSFDRHIENDDVKGLTRSSFRMDSYLLAYLSKEEFLEVAQTLQQRLSDSVIARALQQWPPQIRELSASYFTKRLKSRREDLPKAAAAFYHLINQEVLLPGNEEEDRFRVEFHPDGSLTVQHWAVQKEQDVLLNQKTFFPSETESISLFGLDDDDELVLTGGGKSKIKLTWHGGEDTDKITLDASWSGKGRKVRIMDEEDGNDYPLHPGLDLDEYTPSATEFSADGWLLRHRLH